MKFFLYLLKGRFKIQVYMVKQGERLSEVIKRAGGFKLMPFLWRNTCKKICSTKKKIAFMKSADQLEQSIATAISGRISSTGGDNPFTSISRLITDLENIILLEEL